MKKLTLFAVAVFFMMAISLIYVGKSEAEHKTAPAFSERKIVKILPLPKWRKG